MATKVQIVDDMDGSDGARTVQFAIDGIGYTIDLSEHNIEMLHKAVQPWVERAARSRVAIQTGAANRRAERVRDFDLVALRAWAKSNRVKLPQRGRIPESIVTRYKESGGK